jgi:transcriptional regulator with XRE-family HTH domain
MVGHVNGDTQMSSQFPLLRSRLAQQMAGYQQRLGQRVRTERKRKGWKREDLAHHTGLSGRTIQRIESGATDDPRDGTLEALSETLDIPLEELQPPDPYEEAVKLQAQLDRLEEKLDYLIARLFPAEPEEVAREFERASEASPPASERKRSSKRTRRATRPSSG